MTTQFTPTEAQWGRIGNFAHRAHLFNLSMDEKDFSAAYELATEGESKTWYFDPESDAQITGDDWVKLSKTEQDNWIEVIE